MKSILGILTEVVWAFKILSGELILFFFFMWFFGLTYIKEKIIQESFLKISEIYF